MSVPSRGVVPPLVTPIDATGAVDKAALAALVEWQIEAGVDGVFIGGSTGEIASLTDHDRVTAIATAVTTSAGRVPVIAGVIDTGTRRMVDQIGRAVDAGAEAVVATPPFYLVPSREEILDHYRLLAQASPVPVIAYSIPAATHVAVPPEVVGVLAHEGAIVGFKDSSGDIDALQAAATQVADVAGFGLFTGAERSADAAYSAGATGIVPGLANVDPHGYVALHAATDVGDTTTATQLHARLARLLQIVEIPGRREAGFTPAGIEAFKTALVLRGILPTARTTAPLRPFESEARVQQIRDLLIQAGLSLAPSRA